ncbi:MAG: helix-turn-helix domain-containing protein [Rhodospirillales bacterium]|nr:helix-turn-helix domain-containing protein [Rhodospirillales bacterium]MDE2201040.1 helix-turn-helix domain-containing protein [Rhodospirillales bacterium]
MAGAPLLPQLLPLTQAAEIFGRHPRTLRRWHARGRLRAVKVGRGWFYVVADIQALIAGRLVEHALQLALGEVAVRVEPPSVDNKLCL